MSIETNQDSIQSYRRIHAVLFCSILFLFFLFHSAGLDFWLESIFYSSYTNSFPLKENVVFNFIFHKAGRLITIALFLLILFKIFRHKRNQKKFNFHLYLFFVSLLTVGVISLLKTHTTLFCPWDLAKFGGENQPLRFAELFDSRFPPRHCFPAGHSSGGYTWISLFYANFLIHKKINLSFFYPGLLLGAVFGISQQARGAHFFSHDLATLFICIAINYSVCMMIYRYEKIFPKKNIST